MIRTKFTKFSGEDYYKAAHERNIEALQLHKTGRYVLAMYISGLSVECMLRAFKYRKIRSFDEKHDLIKLLKTSGITELGDDQFRLKLHTAVNRIVILWQNNYRFSPEAKLRNHLKRIEPYKKIKGDILKYYSKKLYDASNEIVTRGSRRWKG